MPKLRGRARGGHILFAGIGVFALVLTGLGIAYSQVSSIRDRVHTLDVSGDVGHGFGGNRNGDTGPVNLLLMGTDTRQGQNSKLTGLGGNLSDTTILVHIYAGRTSALGVSIPRDSMVQMPACKRANGNGTHEAGLRQFNQAYSIGGPGCTIKTVESLTGIHIDHFVVINFNGFIKVVDAVGGVPICLANAINAPRAKLKLNAGNQVLSGFSALGFVRAREGVGDGSDTSRIQRQQVFLASLLRKLTSGAVLANPTRLVGVLNAVADSLTVDPALVDRNTMQNLALSLENLSASKVKFVSTPVQPFPMNKNRLQWVPDISAKLWNSIIIDKPWGALSESKAVATVPPGQVRVGLLNATGIPGSARAVASKMSLLGFDISSVRTSDAVLATSTLRYGPLVAKQVKTLEVSSGIKAVLDPSLSNHIVLSVGKNGVTVKKVSTTKSRKTTRSHPKYVKASETTCVKT
jgi:LCP family protein required for cell wall assembly